MGTTTRCQNVTYQTTVAAGATEIYYPALNYEKMTVFIEPVSGGTASVTVSGDPVDDIAAGTATWHAGSATLTGASANVYDATEYGVNALKFAATTQAATFRVLLKGQGWY